MGMFDIGSRPCLHFGDESRPATIIYNDGRVAIAGTSYNVERSNSYEWEHEDFTMTAGEIRAYLPTFKENTEYDSFIVIDLESGCVIRHREWLRRNDALFVLGKEYHTNEEWDGYIGNTLTVYRHNGTAIIKVFDGDGYVWDALKRVGYNKEEVHDAFPQFTDNYPTECKEHFYICIRESDDAYTDLEGNTVNDLVYESI